MNKKFTKEEILSKCPSNMVEVIEYLFDEIEQLSNKAKPAINENPTIKVDKKIK